MSQLSTLIAPGVLSTFGWSAATSPVLLLALPHLVSPLACSSCTQTPYVQLVHIQNTELAIRFVASSPHSFCSCPPSQSFWPAHSCPLTPLLLHTSSAFSLIQQLFCSDLQYLLHCRNSAIHFCTNTITLVAISQLDSSPFLTVVCNCCLHVSLLML